jgi:hypothetical protein
MGGVRRASDGARSVRSTNESKRAAASAVVIGVLVAAVVLTVGFPDAKADPPESPADGMLPTSFRQIDQGPAGGTLWQGVIPNREVPEARRNAVVYLPPNLSPAIRYPVLYLLHGLRGSPYAYSAGLHFADEPTARSRRARSARSSPSRPRPA